MLRITGRRRRKTACLSEFVNALRECLGKDPLYAEATPGRTLEQQEMRRFYVEPTPWTNTAGRAL